MAQRYIYLSDELNNRLKSELNASKLIQDLLYKHYMSINPENMSAEDLKIFIKKEEAKEEYERKLKELNGE